MELESEQAAVTLSLMVSLCYCSSRTSAAAPMFELLVPPTFLVCTIQITPPLPAAIFEQQAGGAGAGADRCFM